MNSFTFRYAIFVELSKCDDPGQCGVRCQLMGVHLVNGPSAVRLYPRFTNASSRRTRERPRAKGSAVLLLLVHLPMSYYHQIAGPPVPPAPERRLRLAAYQIDETSRTRRSILGTISTGSRNLILDPFFWARLDLSPGICLRWYVQSLLARASGSGSVRSESYWTRQYHGSEGK